MSNISSNDAWAAWDTPSPSTEVEVRRPVRVSRDTGLSVIEALTEQLKDAIHNLHHANPLMTGMTFNMDGYRVNLMVSPGENRKEGVESSF